MIPCFPPHGAGLRIGLYGGSFNPPHEGHRHVALMALRRLQLDRLWFLVTPGNPLKDHNGLASLEARLAATRRVVAHPAIDVTGVEAALGSELTIDTIAALRSRLPRLRFVWIMGGDNLASFHRWHRWRDIAALVPIAVVDRPGATHAALRSVAGQALERYRIPESAAATLAGRRPPAWVYLHGRRSNLSSSALRAAKFP
ncbi:nicotinate-nucleotide adenylyltransferase [Rhizobiales bacterium GAS191]|jgi:nicotinate-nucleotide adenylyltransferase|nr:nicotinate-nucleotide adenylyltransferase [Rhizobiales bacterium GAS113]SEC39531.1 nicotinate-nucleotide adenylyltransferase [Rhizobiales bacterium GAS188]SEC87876.1 nicotinate-nucleotide adenylyltransferase [Rhizobiales bacterium GAS191]